jgi:replicative DNA helicase
MKHTEAVQGFLEATGYLAPAERTEPQVVGAIATDYAAVAQQQVAEAMDLTTADLAQCPRVPWDTLHAVTGALLPWQFWVLAASTGNGKSTTLMSLVAHWLTAERRVVMLPLEQPGDIMRLYLASLRQGLDPRRVLAGRWTDLPPGAKEAIHRDLAWQATPAAHALLHFSGRTFIDEAALRLTFRDAQEFGAEVIVIDHLHRLQMTGHKDGYQALVRICQLLKELAKETRIPVLAAAQLHRGDGDRLAPYYPPRPTAIQGGEVVRQECDLALGVYRPLKGNIGKADQQEIRAGIRSVTDFLEPNCVGFHVLKHRLDGDQMGAIVRLRYERGQIMDPPDDQRRAWEDPR